MSPDTMSYIYSIAVALFAGVMIYSPQTFMGRAKFDDGAIKAQKLVKRAGIAILIFCVLKILYQIFFA